VKGIGEVVILYILPLTNTEFSSRRPLPWASLLTSPAAEEFAGITVMPSI